MPTFVTPRGVKIYISRGYTLPKGKDALMSFWFTAHYHPRKVAQALGWVGPGSVKDVGILASLASNIAAYKTATDAHSKNVYRIIAQDLFSPASSRVKRVAKNAMPKIN